jgi:hypothetical protein
MRIAIWNRQLFENATADTKAVVHDLSAYGQTRIQSVSAAQGNMPAIVEAFVKRAY